MLAFSLDFEEVEVVAIDLLAHGLFSLGASAIAILLQTSIQETKTKGDIVWV